MSEEHPEQIGGIEFAGTTILSRSDGKKIKGTYHYSGVPIALRKDRFWDSLKNETEINEILAEKALLIAQDKFFESGFGPYNWSSLLLEARTESNSEFLDWIQWWRKNDY